MFKENRTLLVHTCKNTSLSLWYEKSVSRLTYTDHIDMGEVA